MAPPRLYKDLKSPLAKGDRILKKSDSASPGPQEERDEAMDEIDPSNLIKSREEVLKDVIRTSLNEEYSLLEEIHELSVENDSLRQQNAGLKAEILRKKFDL